MLRQKLENQSRYSQPLAGTSLCNWHTICKDALFKCTQLLIKVLRWQKNEGQSSEPYLAKGEVFTCLNAHIYALVPHDFSLFSSYTFLFQVFCLGWKKSSSWYYWIYSILVWKCFMNHCGFWADFWQLFARPESMHDYIAHMTEDLASTKLLHQIASISHE